jgi:chitooligosaccharide deacetylase
MLLAFLAIGFGAVFLAHSAPFPFLIDRWFRSHTLWRVSPNGTPTVYLTFDDGPNPAATPQLLDVLAREGVPATFFLIDRHLTPETAPIVRRMFAEGHTVALHSHTRALMLMTPERLGETLGAAADRIEQLAGSRPCRAFRPHAGWRSGTMYAGLQKIDHVMVGWTWQMWDWNWYRRRTADALVKRLVPAVSDGAILVLHDGHHESPRADRRYAVETTARLIPALRGRGFSFGRICEAGAAIEAPGDALPQPE